MPTMDYTLLRGRIRDCGMTQKDLAEKAGISEGQFCQKAGREFCIPPGRDRPNLCLAEHFARRHWPLLLFTEKVVI